ncbi:MAG: hypothetical protein AAGN46_14505 [Acidobacteriota bacterium]
MRWAWILGLAIFAVSPAMAQSGGDFEIVRSTLDGGGATDRSPDDLDVRGTIGQFDVGATFFGESFVTGGFWSTEERLGILFFDGFESGGTAAWDAVAGATPIAPRPTASLPATALPTAAMTAVSLDSAGPRSIGPTHCLRREREEPTTC